MRRIDKRQRAQREAPLLWVLVVTACACGCSSTSSNPTTGQPARTPLPASACTSLGREILKASAEHAKTVPLASFYGIAGVSDEEFAKRRQEYEACATPILTTVKEQLFGTKHVVAVEQAARKQPDVTALDHQLEEENLSGWQQIDAAVLRIAMQCGPQPGSLVRRYEYVKGNITETDNRNITISTAVFAVGDSGPGKQPSVPPIWWHRPLALDTYPLETCVSVEPTKPCVGYRDPIYYDHSFDGLPSIDEASNRTRLVCRFTFARKAAALNAISIRGKGTLDVKTRRVQFIPE